MTPRPFFFFWNITWHAKWIGLDPKASASNTESGFDSNKLTTVSVLWIKIALCKGSRFECGFLIPARVSWFLWVP